MSDRPGSNAMTGWQAARRLATVTRLRLRRQTSAWIALCLAALPLTIPAFHRQQGSDGWPDTYSALTAVLAIVAPLFLARGVAEERDRTLPFLWSRPMPRWSLVVGKYLAGAPMVTLLIVGSGLLGLFLARSGELDAMLLLRTTVALATGALAAGAVALAWGTMVTKQPLAASIAYLLIGDTLLAEIPFALRNASVSYHIRELGDTDGSFASLVGLVAIIAIALLLASWRTRRL